MTGPLAVEALRLHAAGASHRTIARVLGRSVAWVGWAVRADIAPRGRTAGDRERWLVRRGLIP